MIALGALICVAATNTYAGQTYRWKDENGTTHFGDSVPPEYSKTDRAVLNDNGITVKVLPREKTSEERAAEERDTAMAAAEKRRMEEIIQRDDILLSTYLSISEIEALRNRRRQLLDGQIRVTELYLKNLRAKLSGLQEDASRFQPYNSDPNAPPIHSWMAKSLSNTLNSILVYEKTLDDTRLQQGELVAKFDKDIDRFKMLKGLN